MSLTAPGWERNTQSSPLLDSSLLHEPAPATVEPTETLMDAGPVLGVRPLKRRSSLPALVLCDIVALALAIFAATAVANAIDHKPLTEAAASLPYLVVFLPLLGCYGLYRRGRRRLVASMFPDLSQLFHSVGIGCLLCLVVSRVAHDSLEVTQLDRKAVALMGVGIMVVLPVARAVTRWLLRPSHRTHSRVLIVGSGQVASVVLQRLQHVDSMHVVGCVDDGFLPTSDESEASDRLGDLDDLPAVVAAQEVDHVIVAFSPATGAKLASLLRALADDVQISVVPRLFDLLTVRSHVDDLHGLPVVDVAPAALGPADRIAKRAIDVLVSAVGLAVLSPLLIGTAIAIKVTSHGPVFFRQHRTGRNGVPFGIIKFRTMAVGAEAAKAELQVANQVDGPLFKLHDDPRVTSIGRFLRKTSLDEIPQAFNVLMGHMSLVGPRPFVTSESAEIDGWAARRFDVRPGMTGLWQISGRNDLPFEELRRLDYSYVASWSLWWDLRILWHTPASVLRRRGAY